MGRFRSARGGFQPQMEDARPVSWNAVTTPATTGAQPLLTLLDARASSNPFYALDYLVWFGAGDDRSKGKRVYNSPFGSPPGPDRSGAPALARAIRADRRRETGRLLSFREVAEMARAEVEEFRGRNRLIK